MILFGVTVGKRYETNCRNCRIEQPDDADATELLEFLGRKNLARRQEILKATMMFRCLHGLAPEYLYSKFTWRDSDCDLRDSENKLKMFHFRALITTGKALAPMAPNYGTVYHAI